MLSLPLWPHREGWFESSFGPSFHQYDHEVLPLLSLAVGLVLAGITHRTLLWQRPVRGLLAGLTLLIGGFLLIFALYRLREISSGHINIDSNILLVLTGLSFTTELWFRGLWPVCFPVRTWWLAAANALLSGGWYIAWVGQWSALPITTNLGWQAAVLEACLSLLLLVMRRRGVSLYLLALVSGLLNTFCYTVNMADYNPRLGFGESLLGCAPAYLLLLGALLVVPVGWRGERRLVAWAKFIPLCLLGLLAVCMPPYLSDRDERRWQLDQHASAQARWEADLDYLAREFPRRQLDFPNKDTRAGFAQELARLRAQAGKVPEAAMVVGVAHLVARLGVAHTHVDCIGVQPGLHYFPLGLYWCSDGLLVTSASTRERFPLIWARVLRIGDYTPEEAQARLDGYVPYEQKSWSRHLLEYNSIWADLLQAAGLTAPDGKLHLRLARSTGAPFEVVTPSSDQASDWPVETPELPFDTAPGPYRAYFTRQSPKTLYIRYNANADAPKSPAGPFERFVQDTLVRANRDGVTRLVVDLRFNTGGLFDAMAPLLDALRDHPSLCGPEHLSVLIGPGTFSAGVFDAVAFKEAYGATLIGEPTGGLLTTYGNTHWLTLPNSRLRVGYSTRLATCRYGRVEPLMPDYAVHAATMAEYTAKRDPIYQAAISETPPAR